MEHQSKLQVIYFLVAAIIAVPLFRRLGLGAILGYLIAGAVIGPYALQLIPNPTSAMELAELGVVMLLFVIGLEIDPQRLWDARLKVTLLGGGQMLLSALVLGGLLFLWIFNWQQSVLIGLTLALSSTAFAVPLMEEKNFMATPMGRDGFAILLLQDLAVIPLLLLLNTWSPVQTTSAHSASFFLAISVIVGVILFGKFLLTPLLNLVARYGNREIMTAMDLLLVLGTALLMDSVGLSMGMGAFIAGVLLASSSYKHQLAADIEPFKGLLLGLFFISVGMTLDLQLLWTHPALIIFLALAFMLLKALVIVGVFRALGYSVKAAFCLGLILSQGGEFAFVIMEKAKLLTFIPENYSSFIVLVVGMSMALTSPLVVAASFILHREKKSTQEFDRIEEKNNEVIIVGFGRFGQIVARILKASGVPFTALEHNADQVNFVKEFGAKAYFGDATRLDVLEAAGLGKARLLVVAIGNIEHSIKIIQQVKHKYPDIKLIVRSRNRQHVYLLHEVGIDDSIRETFESSLVASARALGVLGFTESQVIEKINIYRNWDESMLCKSAAIYKDDLALRKLAKEGTEELRILLNRTEV